MFSQREKEKLLKINAIKIKLKKQYDRDGHVKEHEGPIFNSLPTTVSRQMLVLSKECFIGH